MGLFDDSEDDSIVELPLFTRLKRRSNTTSEPFTNSDSDPEKLLDHRVVDTTGNAADQQPTDTLDNSNHTLTLDSDDGIKSNETSHSLNDTLEPINDSQSNRISSERRSQMINEDDSNQTFTLDSDDDQNFKDSDAIDDKDFSNDSIQFLFCSPTEDKNNSNFADCEERQESETNSFDVSMRSTGSNWTPIKPKFLSRMPLNERVQKKTKSSVKKSINILNNRGNKAKQSQEEKALQRERDRANKEVLMSRVLRNASKYCFAVIDTKLHEVIKESLDELFAQKECNYRLTDSPVVEMSVTWVRKQLEVVNTPTSDSPNSALSSQSSISTTEVSENHMILVLDVKQFIERVNAYVNKNGQTFIDLIRDVTAKTNVRDIVLVVPQLETYFKRKKSKEDKQYRQRIRQLDSNNPALGHNPRQQRRESMPSISREDMDLALIDMEVQLEAGITVSLIKVNDYSEVSKVIYRFTRAVAECCARKEKNCDLSWYVEADNRHCVDPVDDASRVKLWKQQLKQFPKVSDHIANAIVSRYPTPASLLSAYNERPTRADSLLTDLVVTRTQLNGTTTERKVGRELSQRIHLFMTSEDPQQLLNN